MANSNSSKLLAEEYRPFPPPVIHQPAVSWLTRFFCTHDHGSFEDEIGDEYCERCGKNLM